MQQTLQLYPLRKFCSKGTGDFNPYKFCAFETSALLPYKFCVCKQNSVYWAYELFVGIKQEVFGHTKFVCNENCCFAYTWLCMRCKLLLRFHSQTMCSACFSIYIAYTPFAVRMQRRDVCTSRAIILTVVWFLNGLFELPFRMHTNCYFPCRYLCSGATTIFLTLVFE